MRITDKNSAQCAAMMSFALAVVTFKDWLDGALEAQECRCQVLNLGARLAYLFAKYALFHKVMLSWFPGSMTLDTQLRVDTIGIDL